MFNNLSKLKIGFKIIIGILIVEFVSLACGILMGKHLTVAWIFMGLAVAVVVSQFVALLVSGSIGNSVKAIFENLSKTSDNLTSLSKELTTTAHKLAEGSTQQAASIQETSSTLEESSSMVHQTTQNTKEAEVLARKTKDFASKGNSEMQTMLEAMEELKRSSGEISKIIKVIDEIAFQTNILSLNAAVEAARAGDAGKGFAVVAEEVRNLAQRSAQAAKDTAGIIESNINLSEKCLEITEQVNLSLSEINSESSKVSGLLEEISTASQEQEIGIGQINKAVSQMEQVIHSNAATAQQSADSADQLTGCTDTIKTIMSALDSLIRGETKNQSSISKVNLKKPAQASYAKKSAPKPISKTTPKVEPKTSPRVEPKVSPKAAPTVEKKSEPVNKPVNLTKEQPLTSPKVEAKKSLNPEDIIPLDDF